MDNPLAVSEQNRHWPHLTIMPSREKEAQSKRHHRCESESEINGVSITQWSRKPWQKLDLRQYGRGSHEK